VTDSPSWGILIVVAIGCFVLSRWAADALATRMVADFGAQYAASSRAAATIRGGPIMNQSSSAW
jgi:hypothetical protein